MIMITPAEFEDKLNYILENEDDESAHEKIIDLIYVVLRENGYDRGVDILESM